jgi:4a-hydroxytetrahydrobiopterin dehydratase
MAHENLSDDELRAALATLPLWSVAGGRLHREYGFPDFVEAFGFMASAALFIERMDHHPDWRNVYGKLTIDLDTHATRGITRLDVELATRLEALAQKRGVA